MDLSPDFSPQRVRETAWKELKRAKSDRKHPFRFFYLSTTDGEIPHSRTVVLRDLPDPWTVRVYTDIRSAKIPQLRAHPHGSLLFYHQKRQVQLVLTASCTIHHQNEVTQELWPNVQGKAESDYNAKLPPGSPMSWEIETHAIDVPTDDAHFAVLDFKAVTIDILQLRREGHLRYRMVRQEENWDITRVVP